MSVVSLNYTTKSGECYYYLPNFHFYSMYLLTLWNTYTYLPYKKRKKSTFFYQKSDLLVHELCLLLQLGTILFKEAKLQYHKGGAVAEKERADLFLLNSESYLQYDYWNRPLQLYIQVRHSKEPKCLELKSCHIAHYERLLCQVRLKRPQEAEQSSWLLFNSRNIHSN